MQTMLGYVQSDVDNGFGGLSAIGVSAEMMDVLTAIRVYTGIVQTYLDGKMDSPDLSLISDQRNLVHHTLLSLPSANHLDTSIFPHQLHRTIYEACRLTALIIGVGIIFPLPGQTSSLSTIVRMLRAVLKESSIPDLWAIPSARVVVVWVLALGGIAAAGIPERSWFVNALAIAARQLRLAQWSDLKLILIKMLWYDTACDQAGQELWMEIRRAMSFD